MANKAGKQQHCLLVVEGQGGEPQTGLGSPGQSHNSVWSTQMHETLGGAAVSRGAPMLVAEGGKQQASLVGLHGQGGAKEQEGTRLRAPDPKLVAGGAPAHARCSCGSVALR